MAKKSHQLTVIVNVGSIPSGETDGDQQIYFLYAQSCSNWPEMTWIDQSNVAAALNVLLLPTGIKLGNINITPDIYPKILHSNLSKLLLGYGVSFSAGEETPEGAADDFFVVLTQCRQLEELVLWDHDLKPSIKSLAYRSPVSISLRKLRLASVANCRSEIVAQFCKAVSLASRIEDLSIEAVKDRTSITYLGCLLFWTGISPLQKLLIPVTSWKDLVPVFHRVVRGKRRQELVLQIMGIISANNTNIGPIVAELLGCARLHTVNMYAFFQNPGQNKK